MHVQDPINHHGHGCSQKKNTALLLLLYHYNVHLNRQSFTLMTRRTEHAEPQKEHPFTYYSIELL